MAWHCRTHLGGATDPGGVDEGVLAAVVDDALIDGIACGTCGRGGRRESEERCGEAVCVLGVGDERATRVEQVLLGEATCNVRDNCTLGRSESVEER